MAEDAREHSGFKVVDRRSFGADGMRREDAPETEQSSPAPPPKAAAEPAKGPAPEGIDEGFEMLVEFLANTAGFHLGLVGAAAGEPVRVDLASARAMIDLMGVVQDKTSGNLSTLEKKLLDEVLFELHTKFVEVQKRLTSKRK